MGVEREITPRSHQFCMVSTRIPLFMDGVRDIFFEDGIDKIRNLGTCNRQVVFCMQGFFFQLDTWALPKPQTSGPSSDFSNLG